MGAAARRDRRTRSKYIDLPIPELYDLAADPKEANNLAAVPRDRLQVLFNLLRTYNVAPPNRPGRESASGAPRCKSLGYVSGSAPARATYTEADDPEAPRRDRPRSAHRDDADAGRQAAGGDRDPATA